MPRSSRVGDQIPHENCSSIRSSASSSSQAFSTVRLVYLGPAVGVDHISLGDKYPVV